MKKYLTLGELLTDYRHFNNISQSELAANLNVDIRTVIRWEKDQTLIKPEKEEEIVDETFIPYQVIRNLNATVPIPTYYDFRLRKYALDEINNELPLAEWIKTRMALTTNRIRPVELKDDFENIQRFAQLQYKTLKPFSIDLLKKAVKLLPELNLIMFDHSGYYSGHIVFFPLSLETNRKLRNREMAESELSPEDLVDYRKQEVPVFHAFDVTADSNENVYYILGETLNFFSKLETDYIYSSFTTRTDSYELNEKSGIELIWEDKEAQVLLSLDAPPRFYQGDFKNFLS